MIKRVGVQLIASSDTYKELLRRIGESSDIYFSSASDESVVHVLLDFPTSWSFSQLDEMNSVQRARTVVIVQGGQPAYSDVVASYHVSGVVPANDERNVISCIYAAAASMRTYIWKSGLTYMELRVTRLLLRGLDTSMAAAQLKVSTKTINAHISNAIGKLGFESRAQYIAALLAQHTA